MSLGQNNIGAGLTGREMYMPHLDRNGLNQHVFDRVEERVKRYQDRVSALCAHLRTVNDPAGDPTQEQELLRRIGEIVAPQGVIGRPELGMQRQQIGRAAWLVGGSIDAGSHMRNTLASAGQGGMPQMIDQVAMHVGYNVQALQQEYAGVEAQIAQLEDRIRARNGGTLPSGLESLADSALQERHKRLNDQIATSNPAEMLRTVHTDGVQLRHMVDARGMPVGTQGMVSAPIRYEVRLPADTGITLMVGNMAIRGTDIPLTGGEKWVRFPAEVIRGLNIGNARVLIHRPNQPDAVGTMSRTDHDNLVFNFNGAPQEQTQQRPPVIRTSSVRMDNPETDEEPRQPEVLKKNIEVRPISPMYTGEERQFMIRSMVLTGETDAQAARDTLVTFNGVQLAIPPASPSETTDPIGTRVTRLANGQVKVTSTSDRGAMTSIRFQRPGFPPIDRRIEVRTIGVTPVHAQSMLKESRGDTKEYSITTPDGSNQNDRTTVRVDEDPTVIRQGDADTDINGIIVNRTGNQVTVRLGENVAVGDHTLTFWHGNQEMTRTIHVMELQMPLQSRPTAGPGQIHNAVPLPNPQDLEGPGS